MHLFSHSLTKCSAAGTALASLILMSGQLSAQMIAYEPFDYDRVQGYVNASIPGEGIGGLNGGSGWATPWVQGGGLAAGIPAGSDDYAPNDGWGVVPGARSAPLSYTDSMGNTLVTAGNQVRTAFGNNSWDRRTLAQPLGELGSTVWISFLAQSHGISMDSPRYAFVELSSNATNRLWIGKVTPVTTGNWGIQLPDRPAAAGGAVSNDFGASFPMNAQTMFLMRLDFPETSEGLTTVSVWLNPADLTEESILGSPVFQASNNYVQYNQVGVAGRFSTDFDEIRIGHSFADVTPIPEPRVYALLFGLAVSGLVFWRRRARPVGV